ncbi:MAG: LPS assembly lipoprotein LptE [Sulfurospirillum sp.]
MRNLSLFVILFFFIGCGYKPSSFYTKRVLGENIHVDAKISRKDPKNSVLIKDAVNEAVVGRFGAKLSGKKSADTNLVVSIGSVNFTPTVYDKNGYVIAYKTVVMLNASFKTQSNTIKKFTTVGEFDFPIEANSVISDTKRFEAIKNASKDAINEIISKISIMGIMSGNRQKRAIKRDIKVYLE